LILIYSKLIGSVKIHQCQQETAAGKRINLPGFGTFKLSFRAARKGRNPKTGEEMDIKASYSPSFSASKTFKDMCNPDR
jgi:DNA-binding protein HU-beta